MLFGRELNRCVFDIIANECEKKEELPDICKVALLSYFSDRYYSADMASVLHMVLREMCEKPVSYTHLRSSGRFRFLFAGERRISGII